MRDERCGIQKGDGFGLSSGDVETSHFLVA